MEVDVVVAGAAGCALDSAEKEEGMLERCPFFRNLSGVLLVMPAPTLAPRIMPAGVEERQILIPSSTSMVVEAGVVGSSALAAVAY